jgi:hypothetical protein
MRFPSPGRIIGAPGFVALAMMAALPPGPPAAADERPAEVKTAQEPAPAAGPFAPGQKAAIDPETKKLRQPTHEESAELDKGTKAAAPVETMRTVQLPNGAVMAEVPESMMDTAVVQIGPDGSLRMGCFRGTAAAEEAVKSGLLPAKTKPSPGAGKNPPAPLEEK